MEQGALPPPAPGPAPSYDGSHGSPQSRFGSGMYGGYEPAVASAAAGGRGGDERKGAPPPPAAPVSPPPAPAPTERDWNELVLAALDVEDPRVRGAFSVEHGMHVYPAAANASARALAMRACECMHVRMIARARSIVQQRAAALDAFQADFTAFVAHVGTVRGRSNIAHRLCRFAQTHNAQLMQSCMHVARIYAAC